MLVEFVNRQETTRLKLFSGVKGLVSHGDELKAYLRENTPDTLLISISQGEIDGLREFVRAPFEMNLSDYEIIYGVRLRKYGEVMTPPPIYTEAVIYSMDSGKPATGIDLDQAEFDAMYTSYMKPRHLVRHSIRKKRILNHDFRDRNEYEFAEKWIRRINAVKGLDRIDRERVTHMGDRITDFAGNNYVENHLIVMDHEFFRPLATNLSEKGWDFRIL